jgi:hypothetical protein
VISAAKAEAKANERQDGESLDRCGLVGRRTGDEGIIVRASPVSLVSVHASLKKVQFFSGYADRHRSDALSSL